MPYQTELSFLRRMMEKCRVQMLLLDLAAPRDERVDRGLRRLMNWEEDYETGFYAMFHHAEDNVIYRVEDQFHCNYVFFRLPRKKEPRVAVIGPYLGTKYSRESLLEDAKKSGISAERFQQMENYYGGMPVLPEGSAVFAAIESFADTMWGGSEAYRLLDINRELYTAPPPQMGREEEQPRAEETAWVMEAMEQRYAMENELMRAVTQGLTHKAESLLLGISNLSFEQRLTDPVRNLKNYGIVVNTLLRKAAENGGVHPLYLDRVSSSYARRIEEQGGAEAVFHLMEEMFQAYCRLVNKHATRHYSPLVQKSVIQIDMDPGGDLSLKRLAQIQGVNASYLSSLFKKETGQTVTEYINQERMKMAMRLLGTTTLQVQTVAQRCGIADVNYFSKLFKKYTQRTPKEYRLALKGQLSARETT